MGQTDNKLAEVFKDAATHQAVARIIINHLSNETDVRETALNGLDISACRKILDLGCGFGFFSRAMKNRVHPDAEITGIDRHFQYKSPYMMSCKGTGLKCKFIDQGISALDTLPDKSFDLIICSYALYFFPDAITEIARVLKDDSFFVTITHAKPHMQEFTAYVRSILHKAGIDPGKRLPYESLIDNFSSINGMAKLRDGFCNVKQKPYKSDLIFNKKDYQDFVIYFNFKNSFFLPHNDVDQEEWTSIILNHVKTDLERKGTLKITKDDIIFICTTPVH
jgi:ubiquinone/menaquinone biosynthesis C-methylase UbiE